MKLTAFKVILSGFFALAALIGIFVFATHSNTGSGTKDAIGAVVVWGTLPASTMQTTLTAVTKADQTLKGVTYVQKNPDTLPTDLASAIATGNAPDLILASQETLHSLSKLITPVSTSALPVSAFTGTFIAEGDLLATPTGDGYYGVPFLVDPLVLFSNRAVLSSAGIATPPLTWEALTGLVPTITTLTPTRQITRSLIALGTYDNVHNARAILSTLFLQTKVRISSYRNGGLAGDLSGAASGENSTTPGRAVLNFYTQFADPSKVSYSWNASLPDSQKWFLSGDLALYIGFASEAKFLKAANPNLAFTASPLPQPATASLKNAYGLLYSFMIPRGAKNSSGAYQAAMLLSTAPMQAAAAEATGLAPAALSQLGAAPADPIAAVAYAEALYASGWLSPMPLDTDTTFSSMITSVISGRLTSDTALSSSENALTLLLQK